MPILQLQKRARELGRIRIGQKGDRGQPQKLDRFRVTSPSKTIVEKVAELYGGDAREWTPQGGAQQWEVVTDSKRIPIMVPPQPVTQWLETWTAGGCVHRCDGEINVLTDEPCDPEDPDHKNAKPTTRLNVVLRDVEGIGVFRLESHGWNAAVELPDVATFLAHAGGYVDGWLTLEERVSKADGQTRRFVVPTIEVDVTPAQLMAGVGRSATPQVEGPVQRPQITTGPDEAMSEAKFLTAIEASASLDVLTKVLAAAKAAGYVETQETACFQAAVKRRAALTVAADAAPAAPPGDEPDADAVWQQILQLTGQWEWSLTQVKEDFAANNAGVDPDTASRFELQAYLDGLNQRSDQAAADEQVPA